MIKNEQDFLDIQYLTIPGYNGEDPEISAKPYKKSIHLQICTFLKINKKSKLSTWGKIESGNTKKTPYIQINMIIGQDLLDIQYDIITRLAAAVSRLVKENSMVLISDGNSDMMRAY